MGSPDFAVPSLNALVNAGHDLVAAYCQPPRPAGRGKAERKTAVHERADELGIEVRTPKTLRDAEEQGRFRKSWPIWAHRRCSTGSAIQLRPNRSR
jgi:methionyl-tRNA formyltransferase